MITDPVGSQDGSKFYQAKVECTRARLVEGRDSGNAQTLYGRLFISCRPTSAIIKTRPASQRQEKRVC